VAHSKVERLADRIAVNFDNEYDDDRHGYWTASAVGGLARFKFEPIEGGEPELYDVEVTRVDGN
jgi:hypothetical protein